MSPMATDTCLHCEERDADTGKWSPYCGAECSEAAYDREHCCSAWIRGAGHELGCARDKERA